MKIRTAFFALSAVVAMNGAAWASNLPAPQINNPGSSFSPGPAVLTSSPAFFWSPVPGATGYTIYIVNVTDNVVAYPNPSGVIEPLGAPPFVLPPGLLAGGKTYMWTMKAFNGSVESASSAPLYFQTSAGLQPPPVTAGNSVGVSSFVANWMPVFSQTNYVVDVSTSSSFDTFVNGGLNIQAGSNTSVTIGGLDSSTTYYYRVRAYNAQKTSGNSRSASITTWASVLPAPTAKDATFVSSNSFVANWGFSVLAYGYRVDISTNSDFSTFIPGGQGLDVGNKLSVLITGLHTNMTYYYRVRSYNATETSRPSAVISVATSVPVPAAPVIITPSAITDTGFVAAWQSVSVATAYAIDISTNSLFPNFVSGYQDLDVGTATNKSVGGLKGGTTYYYRVRARNANGASANSGTATAKILPPTLLVAVQKSGFVLSWPTNEAAFKLFYATNVPATTWTSNKTVPSIVAGRYVVTNSFTNQPKLFRLKK